MPHSVEHERGAYLTVGCSRVVPDLSSAPGVSNAAAFASLRHDFGSTVLSQLPSEDVINLQSVGRLPTVLAGLVALLGG